MLTSGEHALRGPLRLTWSWLKGDTSCFWLEKQGVKNPVSLLPVKDLVKKGGSRF